jgi:hypothetical protein
VVGFPNYGGVEPCVPQAMHPASARAYGTSAVMGSTALTTYTKRWSASTPEPDRSIELASVLKRLQAGDVRVMTRLDRLARRDLLAAEAPAAVER